MTPVKQTNTDDYVGNCLAACVASILDLPLEEVPNFAENVEASTREELKDWLKTKGRRLIHLEYYNKDGSGYVEGEVLNRAWTGHGEYCILCGLSPRRRADGSKKYHAVVGQTKGWGFKVVHDPHPDGTGIEGEPYAVYFIV